MQMKICLFVVVKTNKNLTIFIFHKFFKAFLFKCQVISGICFIYLNTIGSLVISREVFFVSEGHRKPETYRANLCD